MGAKVCGACGTSLVFSFRPLQPGQALANGRYTVQRALSKGGMSAIYLAHDHDAFDRPVVIKAMLDYFDPHDVREVQAAKEGGAQRRKRTLSCSAPASMKAMSPVQSSASRHLTSRVKCATTKLLV